MATYCWKCPRCGDTAENEFCDPPIPCITPDCGLMVRDYRAEQTQLVVPGEFLHNPLPADGPVV